jgi:hypothetical protein
MAKQKCAIRNQGTDAEAGADAEVRVRWVIVASSDIVASTPPQMVVDAAKPG